MPNKENKMRKELLIYEEPELEVIVFEEDDIITTSTDEPYPGEDDYLY